MRVAVLATGWAGFNDAACRELAARGVELLIVSERETADTSYEGHTVADYARYHTFDGEPDPDDVVAVVRDFGPDAVLMHSWHVKAYRAAVRALPPGTLRVLWMDNMWRGAPKQWVGRAVAPVYVRPLFDAVMVPSDRTEFYALRLGFDEGDVIRGSLSADSHLFTSPPRTGAEIVGRRRFLACSRLVHHKGADVLADAYRRHRDQTDAPWGLTVAGLGPMASCFEGIDGVEMVGFRQPPEVARLMREASALVVASRVEPYGVAVHEAALSGLPIVTSAFVGAVPGFVQDGMNGWVVPSGDAGALATMMTRASRLDEDRAREMSDLSRALGGRITSSRWARHLHEQLQWRLATLRG